MDGSTGRYQLLSFHSASESRESAVQSNSSGIADAAKPFRT
jgi:hypothetical protein